MEERFKVVVMNSDGFGNYWTEVVGVYADYNQASDRAYEVNGQVVEEED